MGWIVNSNQSPEFELDQSSEDVGLCAQIRHIHHHGGHRCWIGKKARLEGVNVDIGSVGYDEIENKRLRQFTRAIGQRDTQC